MMKSKLSNFYPMVIVLIVMVSGLLSIVPFGAEAADKPIVLRYSEMTGPQGTRPDAIKWWISEVEKRSAGRLKIEMYWSESLLKVKENIRGVGQGVVDLGYCVGQYSPTEMPLWTFASAVPFPGTKLLDVYKAIWALNDSEPALKEELQRKNIMAISIFPYDYYSLWTKKQVNRLEDLKGQKIRVSSDSHATLMQAVGAIPIFLPAADIFIALQRGTVDGLLFPLEHIHPYGLEEVVKFGANIGLLGITPIIGMNLKTFQRLPKDLQQILTDTGREMTFYGLNLIETKRAEDTEVLKKAGVKIYNIPKPEIDKWAASVAGFKTKWIKEHSNVPAEKTVNKFLQLLGR